MSSELPSPSSSRLPDWQLPVGVDRPLWEYLTSNPIAADYDEYFAETQLMQLDRDFLTRHFSRPGRLVDLGCGTGRLVVHFAERGFNVLGVDLSENMLRVCEEKRARLGLSYSLLNANICDLAPLPAASFDYALCMFSTLGMVVGVEKRRDVLSSIHRILKPGGLFALHLHNRWFNAFDPQGRRWLAGDLLRGLRGAADRGDKVQAFYRGIPNLRLHLYTAFEIKRDLKLAGFRVKEMFPLAADQSGKLARPWFWPSLRANGWLILTAREE